MLGRHFRSSRSSNVVACAVRRSALACLIVAGAASCKVAAATDDGSGSDRFFFKNNGPCELQFVFTGGVAENSGAPHVPGIGRPSNVPVTGPGTVEITVKSAPAGSRDIWCLMDLDLSDGWLMQEIVPDYIKAGNDPRLFQPIAGISNHGVIGNPSAPSDPFAKSLLRIFRK